MTSIYNRRSDSCIKEDLVILSHGGMGREIAELVNDSYNILGFLEDVKSDPNIITKNG
ncbi:MAG: hypothetical protein ACE5H1_00840 [Thermodesulfobacteriota bacterium]